MASGTIIGSTGNEYIDAKVEWSSTPHTSTNKSTVTAALYYKRNNTGYKTYGSGTFKININGVPTSVTKTLTITESAWVKAVEYTVTVNHDADGTKAITISATGSMPNTSLISTKVSGTATLDHIPRASAITSAADTVLGTACSIKWTPNSKSFRYKVTFWTERWQYTTKAIHPNQTSAYTYTGYTIPLDVANIFPTAKSGTIHVFLYTFSDSECSNQIGSRSETTITVTVPENGSTKPTATMTLSPVTSLASPFNELYIQGRTKVKATFADGEGKYGADIVSYVMLVVGDKAYGSPSYTSGYLSKTGNIKVQGIVTDSRGFKQTYEQTITVIPYTKPRVIPMTGESSIVCARCDENGNPIDNGTYLKIKAKRSYSKVESNGVQKNFCTIRYRHKPEGGSYSSWVNILASDSASDEIETSALLDGTLLTTRTYIVQVGVVDDLGETDYTSIRIPTDKIFMHRAGSLNSLGIGKYAEEENTFDVAQDITAVFRGDVRFVGEEWKSCALGTGVSASTVNSGRWGGSGVYYRVCAGGKHIYVAFNVSFTTSNSTVRAESEKIPYPPDYDVYALCPVGFADGSRGIATASVSPSGKVNIYAVHKLPGATLSTGEKVNWIDGYIDYWT